MKIKKLPAETISKLQSGVIITDAVQCVLELVHNSLDAKATGIAVRIDLKSYQIRVIDNGKGIAKDDLEFVGERFVTTKYQSLDIDTSFTTYGFKGQALSSLQEVSRSLIIESKSENEGPTFKKVFKNNKALPITESDNDRPGTGTTVTVEDFMFTMPVRRKRFNEVFDMEEIKSQLQYLAIIHHNVCFTLRNENKGLILLQTPQAANILESLKNIYGNGLTKSLKMLHYKENKYEVNGFISLKPQNQCNVQLIYLNKRIITKGVIHKFVNNLTKAYSGKKALHSSSPVGQIMKTLNGSSHNVFIIQIQCPHSYYELFTNLRKTTVEFKNWKDLLKCIHKAVKRTFKNLINSVSLSSSHNNDDEPPKDKEDKKTFGTSLLVNAVKGVPAKRSLHIKKDIKKRKKMKTNENSENFRASPIKINEKPTDKPLVDCLNTINQQKEYTNDSLESPIPKKTLKTLCSSKNKIKNINQSFVEFYEWLKEKFQTDINAFNFYNDFLQFKNTCNQANEVMKFKSPVLGGKPKMNKVLKSKKKNVKNKKKISNNFSVPDEEMAIMTKNQLKIFPCVQLKVQKEIHFSDLENISENINLDCVEDENLNLKNSSDQVFKKPESLIMFNKNRQQVEYSPSLPSSEMQFTNIIEFRNLPESFFCQPSEAHGTIPEEKTIGYSISNSWESHYKGFVSKKFEFFEEGINKENCFFKPQVQEKESPKKNVNLDLDFYKLFEASLIEIKNKTKRDPKMANVEIQVDMSEIPAQKVDAVVQTFCEDPKSLNFENSYVFKQVISATHKGEFDCNVKKDQNISLQSNLSQDVPNPDFWNTTAHMELEKSNNVYENNDKATENLRSDPIMGKNSTTSEYVCGHKSHSPTKLQNERSTSKDTQTIAYIWTDSLTELEYPNEKLNLSTGINSVLNLNSVNTNTVRPETIPIEETENAIFQPIQSNFCFTERHDFVPKGLSPKFIYPKSTKIFTLNQLDKCKLKSTVDDAQNELLANIKWQDDSTGDCLKPTIPDRILFEMRRKAGESGMNYENSILSASMSCCAVKVHNLLHSFAFTKELLSGVVVCLAQNTRLSQLLILGQLDKKFIVTKIQIPAPKKMELISLFDQHAVDERIKLEELINENLSVDGKLVSSSLNPPAKCILNECHLRIVSNLQEKMLDFGLDIKSVNENTIYVYKIPTFLLKKHEKDLKNKKETALSDVIKALIINIVDETTKTRGVISKIPKVIYNALCLEACHKAIKFNKALTIDNMSEMIQKLQSCKLPFQCAHGRPSVIPIIDLEDFNSLMEENETIDFEGLKKFLNKRSHDFVADETADQ